MNISRVLPVSKFEEILYVGGGGGYTYRNGRKVAGNNQGEDFGR